MCEESRSVVIPVIDATLLVTRFADVDARADSSKTPMDEHAAMMTAT